MLQAIRDLSQPVRGSRLRSIRRTRSRSSRRCRTISPVTTQPSEADRKLLNLVQKEIELISVGVGSKSLQPVDFALNGGAVAFAAQPLQNPGALSEIAWAGDRRYCLSCDARNKLNVHCT